MTQFTTAVLDSFFDHLQPDNRFIGMDTIYDRIHRGVQYHDTNFPVYNVIHDHKKETYTIEIALAGYKESDIDVTLDDQTLIVKGDKVKMKNKTISIRELLIVSLKKDGLLESSW